MHLLKLVALVATLTAAAAAAAQADPGPPWGRETPHFNIQVVLRPAAAGPDEGFGLVKFRQPNDGSKIVLLDVWVRDLLPGHSYYLQRASDPLTMTDGKCTSQSWLTLGLGNDPQAIQAITTDNRGTGRAALFRDLATIPTGRPIDIHFRVIDASTNAVVLQSDCYQFTVSQ
jgi:hypothetical protein